MVYYSCDLPRKQTTSAYRNDCLIVTNLQKQLIGIVDIQEILKLIYQTTNFSSTLLTHTSWKDPLCVQVDEVPDIFSLLPLLQKNPITLFYENDEILGLATPQTLLEALPSFELFRLSSVSEFMSAEITQISAQSSVWQALQAMLEKQTDYVVITEVQENILRPIGWLSAADIVLLKVLEVDLTSLSAVSVMGELPIYGSGDDTLWNVYQYMQRMQVRKVFIPDAQNNVVGLIEPFSLLQVYKVSEMAKTISNLYAEINQLQSEKLTLLHNLQSGVISSTSQTIIRTQQQSGVSAETEIDYVLAVIALRLRQSLNLEEILDTAVFEARQWLQSERVLVYKLESERSIYLESVAEERWSLTGNDSVIQHFRQLWLEFDSASNIRVVNDTSRIDADYAEVAYAKKLNIQASMIVPIPQSGNMWGLLIVHQCSQPREWQPTEADFIEKLATQMAISIHQFSLLERSQTELIERKQVEAKLLHTAFHDMLTGLPNRALFMERLEHTIERKQSQPNLVFAVLFLDFDRFKVVNDSLGHTTGDRLLIAIAERIKPCLRDTDTIARLGGDEFVILLENIGDINVAIQVTERVMEQLRLPFALGGYEVMTSASIGIVSGASEYTSAEDVLRDADIAMYRAKSRGKAQYVVFDPSMHGDALSRLQLETELRQALDNNEFYLQYQPIMSLTGHKIVGFEALVRWQHPQRGNVLPQNFIGLAEETGLIIALGEWVLREACRQLYVWQQRFPSHPPLTISVNISSAQIAQANLLEQVKSALQANNLHPSSLKLEITESVLMENIEASRQKLDELRALGVQVYIDDFGTGYSSFSYLQNLPVDVLKIDRTFISRITADENSRQIVQTIIRLAHGMGIGVIAEGIETTEQLACFASMGRDCVQGNFICSALSYQDIEALINEKLHIHTDS